MEGNKILIDFDKKTHKGEDFMEVFKDLTLSFRGISDSLRKIAEFLQAKK